MAADKPLQDIYSTVRIPVTDSIIINDNRDTGGVNTNAPDYSTTDNGLYWNCYPNFYSDRSQNQYSSQFDTWVQKRGALRSSGGPSNFANSNLPANYFLKASTTNPTNNICITQLDDMYVMSFWDASFTTHKIVVYQPLAGTQTNVIGVILAAPAGGQKVTDTIFLSEGNIAGNPTLFISYRTANGATTAGYYSTYSGGVWSAMAVMPGVFPTNITGPFVQMNLFVYIMTTDGYIYNTTTGTINWTALGRIGAVQYPDQGVGLARYKNFLVAFGEDSIEFLTDEAKPAPGSPLKRADAAFIKFGAVSPKGIIEIDDTVYWWAKSSRGKWGLYCLDGYTPVKISTLKEDLLAARSPYPVSLYVLMDRGKQHILTSISTNGSLIYYGMKDNNPPGSNSDVASQPTNAPTSGDASGIQASDFSQGWVCFDIQTRLSWVFSTAISQGLIPLQAINFTSLNSGSFSNQQTAVFCVYSLYPPGVSNGAVCLAHNLLMMVSDPTGSASYVYLDSALEISAGNFGNASYVSMGIQFNTWDFGNEKRKRIHKFKVINREGGWDNNNNTYPYTYLIYNKTDYDFGGNSLDGTVTKLYRKVYKPQRAYARTYFNNLGSSRKWSFAIVQKTGEPFSVKAIELDISQGSA